MIKKIKSFEHKLEDMLAGIEQHYPKLYQYLLKYEPLSILDLGCRVPVTLFAAYHAFNCKLLKGVDIDSQEDCVKEYTKDLFERIVVKKDLVEFLKSANSFFDIYNHLIKPIGNEKSKIENKDDFDAIFSAPFAHLEIELFLLQETQMYDLIIASNILHVFSATKIEEYLCKMKSILKKEGVLLIRVHKHVKNANFDYDSFCKILNKLFDDGELYEYYEVNQWDHSIYANIPNLLRN